MRINQRFPKLAPHGFLERAFFWLDSDLDISIFYAALELRFTFENIFIKHGFASSNETKAFEKMNWQPERLYETLHKEFSYRINLAKAYKFVLGDNDTSVIFGYYLPINDELFSMYGKLDKYLHSQWGIPIGDKKWQKENSQNLRNFAEILISHANPENSLNYLSSPNIKPVEISIPNTEIMLKSYWKR